MSFHHETTVTYQDEAETDYEVRFHVIGDRPEDFTAGQVYVRDTEGKWRKARHADMCGPNDIFEILAVDQFMCSQDGQEELERAWIDHKASESEYADELKSGNFHQEAAQ